MTTMLIEWVVTSVFLILTVLALRALFGKRVSAGLRYALWAVVLVRLLIPVQLFTSPIAGTRLLAETHTEQDVIDWPSAPTAPLSKPESDAVLSLGGQAGPSVSVSTFPQAPGAPVLPDAPQPPAAPDLTKAPVWLGWLWLGGSAAMALVLMASNLRFARRLRRCRIPLEGTDCPLRVYVAVGLPSPCLFGLARPAVYVTPEAAADPAMLRHVLAHEYTHYRHGDHIWSFLRCAALAVHWWDPLVWLSVKLSRRDGELACDEGALKRLGDGERAGYGNTLLALVTAKPGPGDLLCFATTMAGDKKSLKERFSRIAAAPRRWLWAAVAVVLATVLACACAFGSAAEPEAEDGPEDSPAPTPAPTRDLDFEEQGLDLVMLNGSVLFDAEMPLAPDLNRNGVPETVIVGDLYFKEDADRVRNEGAEIDPLWQGVEVWEGDARIWTGIASYMHAGETSFLLYSEGGEDCLMEFNIYGRQGHAHGDYRIFTLQNGEETVVRENHVEFEYCTDAIASVKDNFDADEIAAFVDEVDGLLEHCTLLVDTGYNYRGDPLQVDLRWLEHYAVGYHWLDGLTTLENLVNFKLAAEYPAFTGDLNGDMRGEMVQIEEIEDGIGLRVDLYDDNGNLLWSDEGYYAHAGCNAVFLCELDGRSYLLRYHPYMGQGWCDYSYQLFTLTRDGQEKIVRENSITFDINFGLPHESFDPEAIAAFMDEINGLLANSAQLINTDGDLLGTFQELGRLEDDLWWLDMWVPAFVRDESKSLLENLQNFQAAMEVRGDGDGGYASVLLGRSKFVLYRNEPSVGIGDVPGLFNDDPYTKIWRFAVVDMDGDGTDEVLLYVCGVAGDMGGYLLLYQEDGQIHGAIFNARNNWSNRWFSNLKTDGTFECQGIMESWESVSKLFFTAGGGTGIYGLTVIRNDPDFDLESFMAIQNEITREDDWWAAVEAQKEKPDAVWYDFNEENIYDVFLRG